MTRQIIFDTVVEHLLNQNEKSLDPDGISCLYRGPRGLKCAVGCLIKDEHYNVDLEGKRCGNDDVLLALLSSGIPDPEQHNSLLRHLQSLHDGSQPVYWPQQLRLIARCFSLVLPERLSESSDSNMAAQ